MPRVTLLLLLSAMACSQAVDRTPPRRDVGLPAVPAPPQELTALEAGPVLDFKGLALEVPPGCQVTVAVRPNQRRLICAKHVDPHMPADWKRVGDLPIWVKEGLAVAQTWHQHEGQWMLTQSLHQSKGDQPAGTSVFGSASLKSPQ